jgi:hypothetical protein
MGPSVDQLPVAVNPHRTRFGKVCPLPGSNAKVLSWYEAQGVHYAPIDSDACSVTRRFTAPAASCSGPTAKRGMRARSPPPGSLDR